MGGLVIILMSNIMLVQWQQQEKSKSIDQAIAKAKPAVVNIAPNIELQSLSLLKAPKKSRFYSRCYC